MCMTSKFTIGDCAGGHRLENRDKNRDVSIVPRKCGYLVNHHQSINFLILADNFRPYLTSVQSNDQSDYINAVFVDVRIAVIITFHASLFLSIHFRVIQDLVNIL